MSGLASTGEMARLQQAIAESHDLVIRRGTVLEALNLRTGERVIELGCGGGILRVKQPNLSAQRGGSARSI